MGRPRGERRGAAGEPRRGSARPRSGSLPLSNGRSYAGSLASRPSRGHSPSPRSGSSAAARLGPARPLRAGKEGRPLRLGEKSARVPQLRHVPTSSRFAGPSYTRRRRPGLAGLASRLPLPPAFLALAAAGIALAAVVISLVVGCVTARVRPGVRSLALAGGLLAVGDGTQATYQASLLLPKAFAPRPPGTATVVGTANHADDALAGLDEATRAIEDAGHSVGYVMRDLSTGIAVGYNADRAFYGASSIKGPYVVSAVRYELGDAAEKTESSRITKIITDSDNEAYYRFRSAYGDGCFERLLSDAGLSPVLDGAPENSDGDISNDSFEFFTPNQLLAMWGECREFLASDEPGARWLGEVLQTPANSAIRVTAGSIGTTWSKPGWYPGDTSAYGTTVDAGVLRTESGDVLIAVMTDSPEDFQALESIVSALVCVRTQLSA